MIITSVRNFIQDLDEIELTEVKGTIDGLPFQYFLQGTHTLEEVIPVVPLEEVTKLAYDKGAVDFRNKVILANDILVSSPKIKPKRTDAYQEAKEEPAKNIKSIAKLALTLPKLIEHLEELEARIIKLEKK